MRSDVDFESLVQDHHASLYRFAFSLTRNEPDASDLVQETFLRWAERGHQLEDLTKVKSWLFTTLYREAAARLRRTLRFPHESFEITEATLPEVPPDAPRRSDGSAILNALGRLEETFRAPVALFYLEDCSYPEIATILGIPLGTVKSRISRGISQLQTMLASPADPS